MMTEIKEKPVIEKPEGWGARHTLAILSFYAFGVSYAMRFNLSIAIVAMVNSTKGPTKSLETCSHLKENQISNFNGTLRTDSSSGEFNWSEAEQGFILGSFFWGYVVTQIPGGIIAQKYGGKWPLGLGLFITAIFAILTPWAAKTSVVLLVFARIVQGLGEGLTTPAMHVILSKWAPPDERSKLGSIAYAGASFGTAATMVLSGYLIDGLGWQSVFYCMGILSLCWFVLWTLFMYDNPKNHPRISKEELNYIEKSIGAQSSGEKTIHTPWVSIMTSMPVWAILIGHVGHTYGLYTLLTMLPKYLSTVLHFDIKQNSWISSMPYFALLITSIGFPYIADTFISKKWMTILTVRRSSQSIGHLLAALFLAAAALSGCDRTLTILLLTASVSATGAVFGGFVVNHVDISPNFAGVLMGITNTFSNITGFVAPSVAGLLIDKDPSLENWQHVFFIAAAVYVASVIFYVSFASATEQPWNKATHPVSTQDDRNVCRNSTKTNQESNL